MNEYRTDVVPHSMQDWWCPLLCSPCPHTLCAWSALTACRMTCMPAGVPKPRAPRAKKDASDPSYIPRRAASPTAAAKGGPGSSGGAGALAAAAAGAADTAVGGKKKCKSSTSHFRGVTQHRYTLRWEAHLWDPDAIRSKTAGSARIKGKQVSTVALSLQCQLPKFTRLQHLWGLPCLVSCCACTDHHDCTGHTLPADVPWGVPLRGRGRTRLRQGGAGVLGRRQHHKRKC